MEALRAILTRRSVREFRQKLVSERQIKKILEAAMAAPSARNQQPWHFIVVRDKSLLAKIPEASPHAKMAPSAAAAIIVCGEPALEKSQGFWVQDCSNAALSILLAAHALGLGGVWTAAYPRMERVEGVRRIFGIPESVIPLCVIPIGYPAEKVKKESRFDPARVHMEKW